MQNGELRRSGLPAVGAVAWGTHLCNFYKTGADLVETLAPYFEAGLEQNERCVWITSEPLGVDDARAALANLVPRLDAYVARGQMALFDQRAWYARSGPFDPAAMINVWIGEEERARSDGHAGLRISGNTSWIAAPSSWDRFTEYEEAINERLMRRNIVALCSYSTERCGCEDVFDVVRNHQLALVRRRGAWEVIENSALKLAKEELRQLNAELEQRVLDRTVELQAALRSRDEFLGMASHELKTPLAALLLQLEGLARPGRLAQLEAAQVAERLGKALDNGLRLSTLVERMLDIARIGQGLVPVDLQPMDLRTLARETLARLGDPIQASGATVRLREHGAPLGHWDGARLGQVLTNLLVNALKHARGTAIEVDVWTEETTAVLAVRDHGPGVPAADRARIFERFVQLGDARAEGIGLGLWMVRQIVSAHGGTVGVEDAAGGGARFVVRLPLGPRPAPRGDA
jgi:signal transduction histidine kinase